MRPEASKLLEDMRQAAKGVRSLVVGKTIEQYRDDLHEALTQLRKLDPAIAESITDYRAIIGFRNVLIHGYAVVNSDKTWDIAMRELPVLLAEVDQLLSK
jgi:uncharacterized protein with HEPN domain